MLFILISVPNSALALDNNSTKIYEYNGVGIVSDLIFEETFSESEDNIVVFYILNNCRARIIKQDIIVRIQDIEHPAFDIIIPPPDN